MKTILLDGAQGEGGGQILRSALTLSMITGTPFRIERIRTGRAKPGLLRQHLTAVNAAAAICAARVQGNMAGSQSLEFIPGAIQGGEYRFDIGTAGSCTLVLQTLLPALWFAGRDSVVTVSGGTHNTAAPPADFLMCSWLPLMQRMGARMSIALLRHGFYPAGGGEVRAEVRPVKSLQAIDLAARGELVSCKAIAVVAGLPVEIAQRELAQVQLQFAQAVAETRVLSAREGPGNVLMIELAHRHHTEIFCAFGEKGLRSEVVADRVVQEAQHYLASGASIGEHLADQLVLPMSLAGAGSFTTTTVSSHLKTNMQIVQHFLPVTFAVTQIGENYQVSLAR